MFNDISLKVQQRMEYIFEIAKEYRTNVTERLKRLRQIPPDTGRFISLMLCLSPKRDIVEIGTNAGYFMAYLAAKELERN